MKIANFIIALVIAAFTFAVWAIMNMPVSEPVWPDRIQGFSFQPMQVGQNPVDGVFPTEAEIEKDLVVLKGKSHAIRTYSLEGTFASIPKLARKYGINVALGCWLDKRLDHNDAEIDRLIQTTKANWQNVVRVIVGNEALLRNDLTVKEMIGYLDTVRAQVDKPVSTAEPWHVWLKYPQLADHVDYLAVHMLPYWEKVPLDFAIEFIVGKMNKLREAFPGKPIVITEVGWPSNGRARGAAVASKLNEATFLRRFLERASKEKYTYYVMEAFDQPWKQDTEGAVGAYWGVYDVDRQPKFEFSEPIVMIPEWYYLAIISILIAAITFSMLLVDGKSLLTRARGFLALIAYMAATAFVWVVYDYSHQYLSVITIVIGVLLIIGMLGVIVVLLIEAHEWAEALWIGEKRRPFVQVPVADKDLKKVSIHLPIYNEPADMVIETLRAISVLDYPDYEVIVVDNNTKDPSVWKPVEEYCSTLSQFSFYHLDDWPGYKAGALNYALDKTSVDAEIIAVVDSDYQVEPNWLRDLCPQFSNEKIAIVQAPQDYRDNTQSAFKSMCYNEYRGFFYIGMVTRNERNAIIQHGTMTMIRRKVLEEVNGWGEWCITEDAELGLKIFEFGYEATYIAKSYGKGLIPDTFIDYKKQRFRWAYGAMQIIKQHARVLLGREKSQLSRGQRYHFLAGWLPWIADSVNLIFTMIAIFWSVIMIMSPDQVDPPLVMFTLLPITLFCFKIAKMLYLYRGIQVVNSTVQILSATLAGLALSHTIAKAMLLGLVKNRLPFFRTPKKAHTNTVLKALASAREEALLMVALWLALYALTLREDANTLDLILWIVLLGIQSIPYVASVLVSAISAIPERKKE